MLIRMMNALIRKYKLHKLIPCLSKQELELFSYIENILKGLTLVKDTEYPDYIFYTNLDNIVIIEYNTISKYMWINFETLNTMQLKYSLYNMYNFRKFI